MSMISWLRKALSSKVVVSEFEALEDKLISELEMHRMNDEMCMAGDPPYFDVCEAIPCDIIHRVPQTIAGPIRRGEWAK